MAEVDDRLLAVVVEILETEGYDAVQLREVARRARSSLATHLQAVRHPRGPDPGGPRGMAGREPVLDVAPHRRAEGKSTARR